MSDRPIDTNLATSTLSRYGRRDQNLAKSTKTVRIQ